MREDKYIQKSSNVFAQNSLLKFIVALLAIAFVINGLLTASIANNKKIILVPVGLDTEAEVGRNDASDNYKNIMTRYVAGLMLNVSPGNARKQFTELLKMSNPSSFPSLQTEYYDLAEKIEKANATSLFSIQDIRYASDDKGYLAEIMGNKKQYVSNQLIEDSEKTYILRYQIVDGRFYLNGIYEKVK